jgi:hypothetical protein
VPTQKIEAQGKGVYLLHSEMSALDNLTEAPRGCAREDANAMAFEEATKIIGGRNAVEEFLAYDIWPLSDNWDFEVKRMESPLSKVTMPMPKVTAIIAEQETVASFEVRIASAANQLVGNYGVSKDRAYVTELLHSHLNHIFELAGVNYQSRPEPIAPMLKKSARLQG